MKYVDKENKFIEYFDNNTGFYLRSGIIKYGKDTGIDPFMRNFPQLIDVGVMGSCVNGRKGLCGVQCYQNGPNSYKPNMPLENYKRIVDECKGKTFQYALGGRGDVDQHEQFEDILKYSVDNGIVPNFTSSGLGFNNNIIDICKEYCGAVAVSWYRQPHTIKAIESLIKAGVKTSIHYVLGNNSIDEAIERLNNNLFPEGINAIIFLAHKPVGLGKSNNVLNIKDPKVVEFFNIVDTKRFDFKIGFDSCCSPAIINLTKDINIDSIDTCEAARFSMYITSDMLALPCSFDNQDLKYAVDLNKFTIQEAWNSDKFETFRSVFRNSCGGCNKRNLCLGGCPLKREIVMCNEKERELYEI